MKTVKVLLSENDAFSLQLTSISLSDLLQCSSVYEKAKMLIRLYCTENYRILE